MRGDKLYLVHIGDCIVRVEEYVKDGRDVFMSSNLIQDAVMRNLQVLAQSTLRLSDRDAGADRTDKLRIRHCR